MTDHKPVPADIDIAQAATIRPIREIAAALDLTEDDLELYGKVQGQSPPGRAREVRGAAQREVHRRDRHHPHAARRGEDHHHRRSDAGARRARLQQHRRHPPAVDGADLRHQRRGGRRWLQPDHPYGRLQPAPHRRHPRRECGAQPLRCRHRRAHLPRKPLERQLLRENRADPAQHRPLLRHLEPRGGYERPRDAQHPHRPGRHRRRPDAPDRLRHRRRQRVDGDPGPHHQPE